MTDQTPPPPPPLSAPVPAAGRGPLGKLRHPAAVIIFSIITLGIYLLVYWYKTFQELKHHNGTGIGGGIALLLGILIGIVDCFILGSEIRETYNRQGQESPVSGVTGFWVLIPLIGFIIFIVKVQGALNRYWESLGQTRA